MKYKLIWRDQHDYNEGFYSELWLDDSIVWQGYSRGIKRLLAALEITFEEDRTEIVYMD